MLRTPGYNELNIGILRISKIRGSHLEKTSVTNSNTGPKRFILLIEGNTIGRRRLSNRLEVALLRHENFIRRVKNNCLDKTDKCYFYENRQMKKNKSKLLKNKDEKKISNAPVSQKLSWNCKQTGSLSRNELRGCFLWMWIKVDHTAVKSCGRIYKSIRLTFCPLKKFNTRGTPSRP